MAFNPKYNATPETVGEGQRSTGTIDSTGALRVKVSSGNVSGAVAAYVDLSGTITLGGTAQTILAANTSGNSFIFVNTSGASIWMAFGATAAVGVGVEIPSGGICEPTNPPTTLVSIYGASTGQTFTLYRKDLI